MKHLWSRLTSIALAAVMASVCALDGLAWASPAAEPATPQAAAGDPYLIVDCLLPGATKRLGTRMIIAGRRTPARIPARDCEIRGGEYASADRSNWATSLGIWRPLAESGDAKAQTFVGDILAKGVVGPPNYAEAASWYQKAAQQGYGPAMFTLGALYENGMGVPQDRQTAVTWYRRAAGLTDQRYNSIAFAPAPRGELQDTQARLTQALNETTQLREQVRRLQEAASVSERTQQTRDEAIARDRAQIAQEREALARERASIETAVRAASQRANDADAARAATARAQAQLADLTRREQATKTRENEIAAREAENVQLRTELQRVRAELDKSRDALAARIPTSAPADRTLAASSPPQIVMLDPQILQTRGEQVILSAPDATSQVISGRVSTGRGLMTLTINGVRANPTSAGVFGAELPVGPAATPVQIVAVDSAGGRSELRFSLRRGALAAPTATVDRAREIVSRAHLGKFYALLIGNSHYQLGWNELKTPSRDIEEMGAVLQNQYGFDVQYVRDATREAIGSALYALRAKLGENDSVVIYYAGHGAFLPTPTGDRGFWIPVDGDRANPTNWIAADTIHEWVGMLAARKVLVISDSCFSGLLMRSGSAFIDAGQSEEAKLELLKNEAEGRSRTYLTSGRDAPVLDQGGTGGRHSIFAQALIDTLKANRTVTTGRALSAQVEQTVLYLSRVATRGSDSQQPDYQPMRTAGHVAGDFIFVPRT